MDQNNNIEENGKTGFELIGNLTFCVIDLETTGGHHDHDKIIEIGLVKMRGGKIIDDLGLIINPQMPVPDFIQKLTGLKNEDLQGKPYIEDVIGDIINFIGDSILVAHNSSFDIPFLNSVLKRLHLPELSNKVICTNLMTKYLIPEILNSNLTYMSDLFGIPHLKAHRALEDAKAAGMLLKKYLKIFGEKNIRKINQLYYPRNKFELDRISFKNDSPFTELIGVLEKTSSPVLITFKGENGLILGMHAFNHYDFEKSILEYTYNTLNWEMITLRLLGSHFQGLINVADNFTKFTKGYGEIFENYLIKLVGNIENVKFSDTDFYHKDFIVIHHLIPEQLVIFNFYTLNASQDFIFRFPGHRKKLSQYISGVIKRHSKDPKKKPRKLCIPENLIGYFHKYLEQNKEPHFIFTQQDFMKDSNKTLKKIQDFLLEHPNASGFPDRHL